MANFDNIIQEINANLPDNNSQLITAKKLRDTLIDFVDETADALDLINGATYMGNATPSTNPGTPTSKVFYTAQTPGTYTNFGGLVINQYLYGNCIFLWNGSTWDQILTYPFCKRTDADKATQVDGTGLISHITQTGYYQITADNYTDGPTPTGAYLLFVYYYSNSYCIQRAIGLVRGKVYHRFINLSTYGASNWVQANAFETETNILTSNAPDLIQNDFNNLPNNKIFGLNLGTGHSVLNGPIGDTVTFGQAITFGKQVDRTASDTQLFILRDSNFGDGNGLSIWIREYLSSAWRPWRKLFGNKSSLNILAVGDSIVRGYRNDEKGFLYYLTYNYRNVSVSGATFSNLRTNRKNIPQQLIDFDEQDFDPYYIIADGGYNDYNLNYPLGTVPTKPVQNDTEDEALDLTTLFGGAQHLFYNMIKKYPNAKRYYVMVHRMNNTPWTPKTGGYTMDEVAEGMKKICDLYSVNYVDVYNKSIINTAFSQYKATTSYEDAPDKDAWNAANYCDSDGLHPGDLGYRMGYLPIIRQALLENNVGLK